MAGKVVLCFTTSRGYSAVSSAAAFVKRAGGLGVIIARNPGYTLNPCKDDFPCVAVDYELGTNTLFYIRSNGYETNHFLFSTSNTTTYSVVSFPTSNRDS